MTPNIQEKTLVYHQLLMLQLKLHGFYRHWKSQERRSLILASLCNHDLDHVIEVGKMLYFCIIYFTHGLLLWHVRQKRLGSTYSSKPPHWARLVQICRTRKAWFESPFLWFENSGSWIQAPFNWYASQFRDPRKNSDDARPNGTELNVIIFTHSFRGTILGFWHDLM